MGKIIQTNNALNALKNHLTATKGQGTAIDLIFFLLIISIAATMLGNAWESYGTTAMHIEESNLETDYLRGIMSNIYWVTPDENWTPPNNLMNDKSVAYFVAQDLSDGLLDDLPAPMHGKTYLKHMLDIYLFDQKNRHYAIITKNSNQTGFGELSFTDDDTNTTCYNNHGLEPNYNQIIKNTEVSSVEIPLKTSFGSTSSSSDPKKGMVKISLLSWSGNVCT